MKLDNSISYGIAQGLARSVVGARKFACAARQERPWVYKADIQQFFDNIDRGRLRRAVECQVAQSTLVPVLSAYLDAEICDGLDRDWPQKVRAAGLRSGTGVRQGMPLSPFFAGIYLRDVDQALLRTGVPIARYVDDIVAFFGSEAECHAFHRILRSALQEVELAIGDPGLPGSKTCIYTPDEPAAFLGMEIRRQPTGRYCLGIPSAVRHVIRRRFEDASSPGGLLERKVRLTTMGRYFDSLVCGYLNAYHGAQDADELRELLGTLARDAQEAVLLALFADRLDRLSSQELQFVGIDPRVLSSGSSGSTRGFSGERSRAAKARG